MYNNFKNSNNNIRTFGDYWSAPYAVIHNRNLKFPNARLNEQCKQNICVKNLINPRIEKENNFGKIWYPQMYIDLHYNPESGGYVNANGPNGPYFALGQGNYPRGMFKEVYFGESDNKSSKKSKKPEKSNKIIYCMPEEQKYPVNTEKRCSAALSYARHAPDPCKIAECVKKNCRKYPNVGKSSKLLKSCEEKKNRKKN